MQVVVVERLVTGRTVEAPVEDSWVAVLVEQVMHIQVAVAVLVYQQVVLPEAQGGLV
jgi:hypothetical protein